MRIISGKHKGKKLYFVKGSKLIRPTTDRVKVDIFNIITSNFFDVKNKVVLDLFAGSGALGIECLSREAKEVYFVDNNKESVDLINKNLHGVTGKYKVFYKDFSLINFDGIKFDLVFLDPPYDSLLINSAFNYLFKTNCLNKDSLIVIESNKNLNLKESFLYLKRQKKVGNSNIYFCSYIK